MTDLHQKKCVPCEGGVAPIAEAEARKLLEQTKGWILDFSKTPARVSRTFKTKNFKETTALFVKIALLAEEQGHHPDIEIHYGSISASFTTHAINGLSENDFIMAAKIDRLTEL